MTDTTRVPCRRRLTVPVPGAALDAVGPSLARIATIATATAISATTATMGSGRRIRNGSRRRALSGSVRMTAVASPVEVPGARSLPRERVLEVGHAGRRVG